MERVVSGTAADGFEGFPAAGLQFLRDLSRHNERSWFVERKALYQEALEGPMRALLFDLAKRCAKAKLALAPYARAPVFRIYRDVRFSANKAPYKTHVGAALYRGGDRTASGVLYVHVDAAAPFVAAGFYQPGKETLAALRAAMVAPRDFQAALKALSARGLELERDDALVRLPRDYSGYAGSPVEPYLKLKSLIVRRSLPPAALRKPDLADAAFRFALDAAPLLRWGWQKT